MKILGVIFFMIFTFPILADSRFEVMGGGGYRLDFLSESENGEADLMANVEIGLNIWKFSIFSGYRKAGYSKITNAAIAGDTNTSTWYDHEMSGTEFIYGLKYLFFSAKEYSVRGLVILGNGKSDSKIKSGQGGGSNYAEQRISFDYNLLNIGAECIKPLSPRYFLSGRLLYGKLSFVDSRIPDDSIRDSNFDEMIFWQIMAGISF